MGSDDAKARIIDVIKGAARPAKRERRQKTPVATEAYAIHVTGDGNLVAGGSISQVTAVHHHAPAGTKKPK